jgi:hypothetical protein
LLAGQRIERCHNAQSIVFQEGRGARQRLDEVPARHGDELPPLRHAGFLQSAEGCELDMNGADFRTGVSKYIRRVGVVRVLLVSNEAFELYRLAVTSISTSLPGVE